MSGSRDSSTSVPELTATNYGIWKSRVLRAIGSKIMRQPDASSLRLFVATLITQDTAGQPYQSPLYILTAVSFWHPTQGLNPDMNTYASFLAKLTYIGQLWLLDQMLSMEKRRT